MRSEFDPGGVAECGPRQDVKFARAPYVTPAGVEPFPPRTFPVVARFAWTTGYRTSLLRRRRRIPDSANQILTRRVRAGVRGCSNSISRTHGFCIILINTS